MELSNILELIHAVSDSNLTEFNLQDGNLNISMSTEKTIISTSVWFLLYCDKMYCFRKANQVITSMDIC